MSEMLKNTSKYLGNELRYLKKVLQSKSWSATEGSWNNILERKFAEKFGVKYAVAMNSGTSTLHAALEAGGVVPCDEIISPAFSVMMDTAAIIHANAIPIYADVDPKTFTIDPAEIEKKISPKTKAIITVSIYGLSPDMDPIMKIAKKHNLVVIEDNAQCVLAKYHDKMTGSIGHMASYSFENSKHLSCGEGGMIITDDEHLAMMVRKIGGHGYKNLRASEGRVRLKQDVFQNPHYERHDELGWNYRMSEFNAAIVLAQLERADELVKLRIKAAAMFKEVMSKCNYFITQKIPEGYTHSYYTLGVIYKGEQSIGVKWEDFRKEYISQGGDGFYGACKIPYLEPVMVGRKYVKRYPHIYKDLRYEKGICPIAEKLQPEIMQFKTNYRNLKLAKLKADALERTINKFRKNV